MSPLVLLTNQNGAYLPLDATALTPAVHRKVSSPDDTLSRIPVGHQFQLNSRAFKVALSNSTMTSSLFFKIIEFIVDLFVLVFP